MLVSDQLMGYGRLGGSACACFPLPESSQIVTAVFSKHLNMSPHSWAVYSKGFVWGLSVCSCNWGSYHHWLLPRLGVASPGCWLNPW